MTITDHSIDYYNYLGQAIRIRIDRMLGCRHPQHGFIYPCNYGYIPGTMAEDGEPIDAYLLGVYEPVEEYSGKCIAVIERADDLENKLVICPTDQDFSLGQIAALVAFQERYFDSNIVPVSMRIDRVRFPVTVHIILENEGRVFMLRRANTGYEDGNYSLVAGHLDGDESVIEAAIRETYEEAGIRIRPDDLEIRMLLHRKSDEERFDYVLLANSWVGIPHNAEHTKCDRAEWYPLDRLPENTIPYIRFILENIDNPDCFLQFGWD